MLSFFASSNNSNSRQHSKIKILERARFENMNYGKLTQDIFERTVHKTIQNNSILYKNHFSGTGLGADCAILPLNNDKKDALLVTGQALAYGNDQYSAVRAMIAALNHVAVMGGVSADRTNSAEFIFMVPEKLREIKVRRMIEQAAIKAQEMGVLIASVQTQVLPMVNETVVTCNVCGARVSDSENDNISINNSHKTDTKSKDCGIIGRNGNMSDNVCDVVMTKWIGLEGTSLIARANGEKLKERYPHSTELGEKNVKVNLLLSSEDIGKITDVKLLDIDKQVLFETNAIYYKTEEFGVYISFSISDIVEVI